MKPSQNCIDFIAREEGIRLKPYYCQAGVPTIGYGSTMYPDGRKVTMKDMPITKERAMQLLKWEVETKAVRVAGFLSRTHVTQNQFDSIVSFAFNVGIGALESSRLLKAIQLNPKDARTQAVETMDDKSVAAYLKKSGIRAIPLITYYFTLWCKITVKDPATGKDKKILSEGLIKRRLREAKLFHS